MTSSLYLVCRCRLMRPICRRRRLRTCGRFVQRMSVEMRYSYCVLLKATPRKKISEYRLKCQCQSSSANSSMYQETTSDGESLKKLSAEVAQFKRTTNELQKSLKCVQLYQLGTIVLFLIVGLLLGYFMHKEISAIPHNNYCTKPDTP